MSTTYRQKYYENIYPVPDTTPEPPHLETTEKEYLMPCPVCDNSKAVYTIYTTRHRGTPDPGYYARVECPACSHYEFTYIGPDN